MTQDLDTAIHDVLDKAFDALAEATRAIRELIAQRDRLEEANQRLVGALDDIAKESNDSDQCQYLARKAIAHEESLTP